jgi:hypothetical protein
MKGRSIDTVADACCFLRTLDVEIIGTAGGWILQGINFNNQDFELTCDTDAEPIDYARTVREIYGQLCEGVGLDSIINLPAFGQKRGDCA